jgi:hypothetical protein
MQKNQGSGPAPAANVPSVPTAPSSSGGGQQGGGQLGANSLYQFYQDLNNKGNTGVAGATKTAGGNTAGAGGSAGGSAAGAGAAGGGGTSGMSS